MTTKGKDRTLTNRKMNWLATLHPYVKVKLTYDPDWNDPKEYVGWLIPYGTPSELWGSWKLLADGGKAIPFTDINLEEIEILETPFHDKEGVKEQFED